MNTYYADILYVDYDSVKSCILEQEGLRYNLTGERIIIKWLMESPMSPIEQCIIDLIGPPVLGESYRTHTQALDYYDDPANGWCEEP